MIYLHNITDAQVLFIPKNGEKGGGSLSLRLRNTINQDFIIDEVTDLGTTGIYYNLAIALPEGIPCGEYEYTLHDGAIVLSKGLLIIAEDVAIAKYFNEHKYEQYTND